MFAAPKRKKGRFDSNINLGVFDWILWTQPYQKRDVRHLDRMDFCIEKETLGMDDDVKLMHLSSLCMIIPPKKTSTSEMKSAKAVTT